LKKELFDTVKKESIYMGILFFVVVITFKIAFYKESFVMILRTVLSLFWLFAIPGYFVMLYWRENLDFMERFIIGIILSAAIIGIFSYYLGLLGLNIKYHAIIFPIALISLGIVSNFKNAQNSKD
jgi:uncharacterized membrane protein